MSSEEKEEADNAPELETERDSAACFRFRIVDHLRGSIRMSYQERVFIRLFFIPDNYSKKASGKVVYDSCKKINMFCIAKS